MRRIIRRAGTLLALLALLTACGGGSIAKQEGVEAPSAPAVAPALELEACVVPGTEIEARCGALAVPQDWSVPRGRAIELELMVLPAKDSAPEAPVFVLAGGPGQAATQLVGAFVGENVDFRGTRDVVFVDQRGTGGSNGMQCAPRNANEMLRALALDLTGRVESCLAEVEGDPRYYATPEAMRDLEAVREALGYEVLNLWSGSYGTRAALEYVRRYPERVRTVAMQGAAPADYRLPQPFAPAAEAALDAVLTACESDEACRSAFGETRTVLHRVLARLADDPARVQVADPLTGDSTTVVIDDEAFAGGLRLLLYGTPLSRLVPLAIHAAAAGQYQPFLQPVMSFGVQLARQLSFGMLLSVVCTEDAPRIDTAEAAQQARDTFLGTAPVENMLAACEHWPRGELPGDYTDPVRAAVPTLIISGDEDPVTPPVWGDLVASHLPRSLHVVVPRKGHTGGTDGCVERLIDRFIQMGSVRRLNPACAEDVRRPPFVGTGG